MPRSSTIATRRNAPYQSGPSTTSLSPPQPSPLLKAPSLADFRAAQLLAAFSHDAFRSRTGGSTDVDTSLAEVVWTETDRMLFLLIIDQLPLLGRSRVPVFIGRSWGRNELIGMILALATGKIYTRKQISSHSQTIKKKVDVSIRGKLSGKPLVPVEPGSFVLAGDIVEVMGFPRDTDLLSIELPAQHMPVSGHPEELLRLKNLLEGSDDSCQAKEASTESTPAGSGPSPSEGGSGGSGVATTESKRTFSISSAMSLSGSATSLTSTSGASTSSQPLVAHSVSASSGSGLVLSPPRPLDPSSGNRTASPARAEQHPRRGSMPYVLGHQQGTFTTHPHLSLRDLLNST